MEINLSEIILELLDFIWNKNSIKPKTTYRGYYKKLKVKVITKSNKCFHINFYRNDQNCSVEYGIYPVINIINENSDKNIAVCYGYDKHLGKNNWNIDIINNKNILTMKKIVCKNCSDYILNTFTINNENEFYKNEKELLNNINQVITDFESNLLLRKE